jgi:membrane protein DedA with SNARE-associated domain
VRLAATPLLILFVVCTLYAIALLGLIPTPKAMLTALATRLTEHHVWFVLLCSLLENVAGLNAYFPGAFVILFSMASTHGDVEAAIRTFSAIVGGAGVAHHVNYIVGRSLRRQEDNVTPVASLWRDIVAGLAAFWHPQMGSAFSLQQGMSSRRYSHFVIVLCAAWFPWNVFWGVLMYELGRVPVNASGFMYIFVAYLGGWIVLALLRAIRVAEPPNHEAADLEA